LPRGSPPSTPNAEAAVLRVRDALISGKLGAEDLSARGLGKFLGKTSSVLYHHWGSLDRFLYAVSRASLATFSEALIDSLASADPLRAAARTYVRMALEHPALFHLALVRPFDWEDLKRAGQLGEEEALRAFWPLVEGLSKLGSPMPLVDARVFHASVHGIASLAAGGRMNSGDLSQTDEAAAYEAVDRVVELFRSWYGKGRKLPSPARGRGSG
jgi:AcrR family transcriptional regulator